MIRRVALLLCGLTFGCAEFVRPELGVCGNRVVESGEACDDPDDPACGDRNDPGACRWSCNPALPDPGCPAGDLCGSDRVCRAPSGDFSTEPLRVDAVNPAWIAFGELDGDGHPDAVVQRGTEVLEVHYFEAGSLSDVVELARPVRGLGALGDLDGDGLDDLFFAPEADAQDAPSGVTVWSGEPTRLLTARRFATLRTEGSLARLLSPTPERDRVLEVVSPQTTRRWSAEALAPLESAPLGVGADELGRAVATADLDGGLCEPSDEPSFARPELALATIGATEVRVVSVCVDESEPEPRPSVPLPDGVVLGSAGSFFGDDDGDGALDLVVQGDDGRVWIARGNGDGTFAGFDDAPLFEDDDPDAMLLGVANLDDDVALEIVTSEAYVGAPGDCEQVDCEQEAWTEPAQWGTVVDINGDGARDVATLHDASLVVHLADPQRPGRFEHHSQPLLGASRELVVGDFNRDTVEDVGFVEQPEGDDGAATARVAVLYGGDLEDWRIERFGPFVAIDTLAVDQRSILVVRTLDGNGRAGGAFVRPDRPDHDFGATPRMPVIVRDGTGRSVAGVATIDEETAPRIVDFGFASGTLSPHDVVAGDALPSDVDETTILVAPIDLDADGRDELVIAGTSAAQGRIWLASRAADGRWTLGDELALGPGFSRMPIPTTIPDVAASPGSTLAVGDIDGDGDADVLVTTDESLPRVVALVNEGARLRPVGDGFLSSPSLPGFDFAALVPWHADADDLPQWLVAGEDGIGLATVDIEARSIVVSERFEVSTQTLATADIDADGLLDLVAGTRDQLRVYFAQERTPGE